MFASCTPALLDGADQPSALRAAACAAASCAPAPVDTAGPSLCATCRVCAGVPGAFELSELPVLSSLSLFATPVAAPSTGPRVAGATEPTSPAYSYSSAARPASAAPSPRSAARLFVECAAVASLPCAVSPVFASNLVIPILHKTHITCGGDASTAVEVNQFLTTTMDAWLAHLCSRPPPPPSCPLPAAASSLALPAQPACDALSPAPLPADDADSTARPATPRARALSSLRWVHFCRLLLAIFHSGRTRRAHARLLKQPACDVVPGCKILG